jgi:spore coat protein U-like protein
VTFPRIAAAVFALAPCIASAAMVCTASGTAMGLGTYTGDTSTPADAIGTFVVRCTRNGGPASVIVTLGIGPSGTTGSIASRALKQVAGTDQLAYNLYTDALRLNVWGETIGVDAVTQSASVPNKATLDLTFNVYGRIPGLQNVRAGAYSDALVVTFTY